MSTSITMLRHCVLRSSSLTKLLKKPDGLPFIYQGKRFLFGGDYLGLDNFQRQRMITNDRLGEMKDRFRVRMDEYMSKEPQSTIFTDDLKTMVYIGESDADISTINEMIKRYFLQSADLQVGQFTFGPIIMRLLYSLKKSDLALSLFNDPTLTTVFNQFSSFLVLMDLLYEAGRYDDVMSVFDSVCERQLNGRKYPNDCTTVAFGTCYKQNTKESYEKMLEILKGMREVSANLSGRSVTFAALLALNQNNPAVALEITATLMRRTMAYDNLRLLALSQLGRGEDCLPILRSILQNDSADTDTDNPRRGFKIFKDVLTSVRSSMEQGGENELLRQMDMLQQGLVNGGHIIEQSLETFANQPVLRSRNIQNSYQSYQRQRDEFDTRGQFGRQQSYDDNDRYGGNRRQFEQRRPSYGNDDGYGTRRQFDRRRPSYDDDDTMYSRGKGLLE